MIEFKILHPYFAKASEKLGWEFKRSEPGLGLRTSDLFVDKGTKEYPKWEMRWPSWEIIRSTDLAGNTYTQKLGVLFEFQKNNNTIWECGKGPRKTLVSVFPHSLFEKEVAMNPLFESEPEEDLQLSLI